MIVVLVIGLVLGLGIGHMQVRQEQKISQDKMKEVNRKIAYVQKKMTEEKNEATDSMEQQCQGDMDKLQNEKKGLAGQMGKLNDQIQKMDIKLRESAEASARTKKESDEAAVRAKKELHDMDLKSQEQEKKAAGEKQALQAELKKTNQALGQCASNNAGLCNIADGLLKKYRNKGLGSILRENEPLTQLGKIELEHLNQQYVEEIQKLKIRKNEVAGKHDKE